MNNNKSSAAMKVTSKPIAVVQKGDSEIAITQSFGGTLYGTTPGGTRIKYTPEEFKKLSKSPLCRDPPMDLPNIPGLTTPLEKDDNEHHNNKASTTKQSQLTMQNHDDEEDKDTMFDMEMEE